MSLEDGQAERRAPDPLARQVNDQVFNVQSARVEPGRIAETELEVDGRGHANERWRLVMTNEAAKVVRALDVKVDRRVDRLSNGCDLREREIDRQVDRRRTQVFE